MWSGNPEITGQQATSNKAETETETYAYQYQISYHKHIFILIKYNIFHKSIMHTAHARKQGAYILWTARKSLYIYVTRSRNVLQMDEAPVLWTAPVFNASLMRYPVRRSKLWPIVSILLSSWWSRQRRTANCG